MTVVTWDRPSQALGAVRGLAVMSGGPVLLAAAGVAGLRAIDRARRARRRPPALAVLVLASAVADVAVLRPWSRSWGATRVERREALPGDELVPDAGLVMTRAVTVDAPLADVWPWLAQIGQDRAGFYSWSVLENLAGCRMRNADRVHEEWQQRVVGEVVALHPLSGVRVERFEPEHCIVFRGWAFTLVPLGADRTRLIARTRVPRGLASAAYAALVELPHFVMERRMLLGLQARAERSAAVAASGGGSDVGSPDP